MKYIMEINGKEEVFDVNINRKKLEEIINRIVLLTSYKKFISTNTIDTNMDQKLPNEANQCEDITGLRKYEGYEHKFERKGKNTWGFNHYLYNTKSVIVPELAYILNSLIKYEDSYDLDILLEYSNKSDLIPLYKQISLIFKEIIKLSRIPEEERDKNYYIRLSVLADSLKELSVNQSRNRYYNVRMLKELYNEALEAIELKKEFNGKKIYTLKEIKNKYRK